MGSPFRVPLSVALISYPMLFQRLGGLQVQILETQSALERMGVSAQLFEQTKGRLSDFDIIHVFGAINGTERIVEAAKDAARPVVLSSVLNPPLTRRQGRIARFCDSLTGRLTGWTFQTTYRQAWRALNLADVVIALGPAERDVIVDGFCISPDKIRIVPNGVASRFFDGDGAVFRDRFGIKGRFALQVSSVSGYKNQLAGIRAARTLGLEYVMIGGCGEREQGYLERCLSTGGGQVRYLGAFPADDPILPSAYAAAEVFVLPSQSEVMPLVVLESLAAGTPVVMTRNSSLKFADAGARVMEVDPRDDQAIANAVEACIAARSTVPDCQALVTDFSWHRVAEQIKGIYEELLAR